MSRLFAIVSHLVLGFSLVLTGSGCSCGMNGTLGTDAGSTPASVQAANGADDGCCDGPSEERDRDSEGECCDGGDCTLIDRSEQVAPLAQLGVSDPTVEIPSPPSTAPDPGVGRGFDKRQSRAAFSQLYRASDLLSKARSTAPAKYLALQMLRI